MLARGSLLLSWLAFGCATSEDPLLVEVRVPVETRVEPSTDLERAAVQILSVADHQGHCGGFLQSSQVLVTAAHCVPEGSSNILFRRLGSNEVESAELAYISREPKQDIAYLTPDETAAEYLTSRALQDGERGTLLRPLWGTRISGPVELVVFDDGVTRPVLWGLGAHGGDSGSPVVGNDGAVLGIVSTGVWAAPGEPITGVTIVPVPPAPWQKPR
jgi:hypothetical protein